MAKYQTKDNKIQFQERHKQTMTQMTQLSMVGFKKLHSPIWNCNFCERLTPFPDVDSLLAHLKDEHKLGEVNIDADGGAWISETVTETTN